MNYTPAAKGSFWTWFVEHEHLYFFLNKMEDPEKRDAITDALLEKLHTYCSRLFFLIGGHPDSLVQEFIVTAEGNAELFPAVEELIAAAPALEQWKFTAFIPPTEEPFTIEFPGVKLDTKALWFIPLASEEAPGSLGIRVGYADFETCPNKNMLNSAVLIVLDNLLGEKAFALDVDYVEIEQLPEAPEDEGYMTLMELSSYIKWHKENAAS